MIARRRKAKVLPSANGRGVFAQRFIAEDEVVGRVQGIVTDGDDVDPRYLMELDNDLLLIPRGTFRYLNHCCEPNCCLFMWEDGEFDEVMGSRPLFVGALRDIEVGEELTIDYSWPADFAIPCLCHAPNCRGWIVDTKQLARLLKKQRKKAKKARAKKNRKRKKAVARKSG